MKNCFFILLLFISFLSYGQKSAEFFYHTPNDTFPEYGQKIYPATNNGFILIGQKQDSIGVLRVIDSNGKLLRTKYTGMSGAKYPTYCGDEGYCFLKGNTIYKKDSLGITQWNYALDTMQFLSMIRTADSGIVLGVENTNTSFPFTVYLIKLNKNGKLMWTTPVGIGLQCTIGNIWQMRNGNYVAYCIAYNGADRYRSSLNQVSATGNDIGDFFAVGATPSLQFCDGPNALMVLYIEESYNINQFNFQLNRIGIHGSKSWNNSIAAMPTLGKGSAACIYPWQNAYLTLMQIDTDQNGAFADLRMLDTNGNQLWQKLIGIGKQAKLRSIIQQDSGYMLFGTGKKEGVTQFYLVKGYNTTSFDYLNIEGNQLGVFPNPSNGIFKVKLPMAPNSPTQLYIYSVDGKLLNTVNIAGGQSIINININQHPNGIYLLKAISNNVVLQGKVIKD